MSIVKGFHGTTCDAATVILKEGFKISENEYDWLGDGAYFFQDSPNRARDWARIVDPNNWAVVGAEIDLSDCLDLLDPEWVKVLSDVYDLYLKKMKASNRQIPKQVGKSHRLDREVTNYAVKLLDEEAVKIASVRGAFMEGAPAFPNSALFNQAHIQIAVRDTSIIRKVWIECRCNALPLL